MTIFGNQVDSTIENFGSWFVYTLQWNAKSSISSIKVILWRPNGFAWIMGGATLKDTLRRPATLACASNKRSSERRMNDPWVNRIFLHVWMRPKMPTLYYVLFIATRQLTEQQEESVWRGTLHYETYRYFTSAVTYSEQWIVPSDLHRQDPQPLIHTRKSRKRIREHEAVQARSRVSFTALTID